MFFSLQCLFGVHCRHEHALRPLTCPPTSRLLVSCLQELSRVPLGASHGLACLVGMLSGWVEMKRRQWGEREVSGFLLAHETHS